MLTLRCTQKLLQRLKSKPSDAAASTTVLGDWYANHVILQRRHLVICCAERSLLPLVVSASPLSTLAQRIREALGALLRDLGVPDTSIAQELDAMNDVVIAKTNDRSIVGVLNDYVRMADSDDQPPHEMSLGLARTPIFAGTPHTVWPIDATLELFKKPTKARAMKARATKAPAPQRRPACELCGKRGKVYQTECCGRFVCDDEDKYVMFSYSRDSCSRNHRRYTLCGSHFHQGHAGAWQDCMACRVGIEPEMVAWYGTNEFNFEKMANPPAFKPTLCAKCKKPIHLGTDGYMMDRDGYRCMRCAPMR